MFKLFAAVFLAPLVTMFVFVTLSAHVQQVSGFNMVAQCSIHDCYEINNMVFVIK